MAGLSLKEVTECSIIRTLEFGITKHIYWLPIFTETLVPYIFKFLRGDIYDTVLKLDSIVG